MTWFGMGWAWGDRTVVPVFMAWVLIIYSGGWTSCLAVRGSMYSQGGYRRNFWGGHVCGSGSLAWLDCLPVPLVVSWWTMSLR